MTMSTHRNTLVGGALAAALLLLLIRVGPAQAEADGPDFYRVTGVAPEDVLNIRAEPSPHAEKIGEIPPNANCVRNLGCQGGLTFEEYTTLTPEQQSARIVENPRWCRIEYQETTGWVAGLYLAEGDCR
jgi:hypothetical protein